MLIRGAVHVGLFAQEEAVRAVALFRTGNGWRLHHYGSEPLPADTFVDGEVLQRDAMVSALRALRKRLGVGRAVVFTAVGGSSTIVRVIDLPRMTDGELRAAMRWELPQHLPLPVDQAVTHVSVLHRSADSARMKVLLVATRKVVVEGLFAALRAAALEPAAIEIPALAQWRALSALGTPRDGAALLTDAHPALTEVHFIHLGAPVVTRVLPSCADRAAWTTFLGEMHRSVEFFASQYRAVRIGAGFVFGNGLPAGQAAELAALLEAYLREAAPEALAESFRVQVPDFGAVAAARRGRRQPREPGGGAAPLDDTYLTALGLALRSVRPGVTAAAVCAAVRRLATPAAFGGLRRPAP